MARKRYHGRHESKAEERREHHSSMHSAEREGGDMMGIDRTSPANMPQNVIMREYADYDHGHGSFEYPDTYRETDRVAEDEVRQMIREKSDSKY